MTIELTDAGRNEYEALVRDAVRYRWLRGSSTPELCVHVPNYFPIDGIELDAAIDAAIAAAYKKRQEGV